MDSFNNLLTSLYVKLSNCISELSITSKIDSFTLLGRFNISSTFKFKFSYLEDKDTFATWNAFYPPKSSQGSGNPSEPYSQDLTNANNQNLNSYYYLQNIDDGSLYTNFINRTLGGSLPFLFCLDEDEHKNYGHNPDNWAMVKLDKSSFSAKKVANDWYDVSFNFVECW